ncbi:hypothetical protein DVV91_10625 [Clostridium botulinum]|uniref:GIY-YIG nuclease family protein n=1 Tax=Clostridium botulinum TaxID=1491 RepID=UPI00077357C2|nr:GIY-YIG nuclease family protein [Clostridium botulinum]MBN1074795.1 hypothetical protein [Clostridium botulinum]NFL87397.1 hypothetical protein [Clostridium botulinum]NFO21734.1 hypothetical protein [Clostridium botulinum]
MKYKEIKNLYSGNVDDLPATSGVYLIICSVNLKKYVGKSKNMRARVKQELNDMEVHTIDEVKNKKMKADFDKYGMENFQYFVLQECSMELGIYLEDFYIRKYDCVNNGYNSRYGDLKSLNKQNISSSNKYFLSNIEIAESEAEWIIKKLESEIFNKESISLRYCKLKDFIDEFKIIICKYVTIEMIIEVIIRFDFPVFVYNQIGRFYYQITAQEFKRLYNNEYSYHNKSIESDLVNNFFYKRIENIGVGIYRYNITDKLVQFVKNYNNNLYQEECKLEDEACILRNNIKEQGNELKKTIQANADEKTLRKVSDMYFQKIKHYENFKKNAYKNQKISEISISKYNLESVNTLKSMNIVINLY